MAWSRRYFQGASGRRSYNSVGVLSMWTIALAALVMAAEPAMASRSFAIRVVDEQTGRGVPLVELRTVHGVRLYTDSAGIAAFDEPGLMDGDVFFFVSSHGYEFGKDGFGYRGRA